jgi:hypothetical protein
MRNHYSPRKYLRGFCDPQKPNQIWVYDRINGTFYRTAVENVALENGFYSDEDEKDLNDLVEMPANPVLDQLRAGLAITAIDRRKLALYIATFIYRVPQHRANARAIAPAVFDDTIRQFKEAIRQQGNQKGIANEKIQRWLDEADTVRAKHGDSLPAAVLERIRKPWPREDIMALILRMKWRIVTSSGPVFFLTNDNPAFYFSGFGLGNENSELSFPLSSKMLLHGYWWHGRDDHAMITQDAVAEFNRRIACTATRFVYYHERQDWIPSLVAKKETQQQLCRIVWPNR